MVQPLHSATQTDPLIYPLFTAGLLVSSDMLSLSCFRGSKGPHHAVTSHVRAEFGGQAQDRQKVCTEGSTGACGYRAHCDQQRGCGMLMLVNFVCWVRNSQNTRNATSVSLLRHGQSVVCPVCSVGNRSSVLPFFCPLSSHYALSFIPTSFSSSPHTRLASLNYWLQLKPS